MQTYTLDGECSDNKVSIRHDRRGGDVELIVGSLKVLTNVVSPVLLTLAL